jgi:ABC-type lipoprotein export system ATPase subunit
MNITAADIHKSYREGEVPVPVLRGTSLSIASGECVALLGASGSGKSTLLHCLALLDRIDSGSITFDGQAVARLDEEAAARFRLRNLGFVFQFHHLIPELTAEENVQLPATLAGESRAGRAAELLGWVGLGDKRKRFPWQLSGGEQQRVAIARALVNEPRVLFTDEATGNLDRERALEVLELILRTHREFGTTVLSVTHDAELARRYGRRYRLKDGRIWDLLSEESTG